MNQTVSVVKVKTVKIGIVGFGTVGAGAAATLLANREVIAKRTGVNVELVRIADLDITTDRGVTVPADMLTTNADDVIREADIVVELVGGTTFAKTLILNALNAGKSVVTANKALLAKHGEELFAAAAANNVDLYYEASVGGGIPVIKALQEGLVANRIQRIYGILNGTCNYILTRMEREGADFADVLADAQRLGYAEAEPSLDIDGFDTAHKASILASLAFGRWYGMDPVSVEGIRNISLTDLRYADELGYRIKLLGIIKAADGNVEIRVHPTLIPKNALLANISDVFNGVMIEGDMVGQTLFYGRGAGRNATASAVVADITDVAVNIANGCPRRVTFRENAQMSGVTAPGDVQSRYYIRLQVKDAPGVMAAVTNVLADQKISICSLIQPESSGDDVVPLVILTHMAGEAQLRTAVKNIEDLPAVCGQAKIFRIEDL
ncbi:MAG: homoserine dehydrogenase [Lentisphaeria bacterium]|nr:homoserine dehydrogenase [Lentisphaeria bacterium]